mmetsp:Transcript_725/g.964  ORF Transcript_725/g.964 Transcript_725/m.964 type:complete len:149 (+) Transcript_725:3-449(+)
MKSRDETIEDLSKRLTVALEEVERMRLTSTSMRRQIIFPPSRPSRSLPNQSDPFGDAGSAPPSPKIRQSMCSEGEEGSEHDDSTKRLKKAQLSLEAAMVQSSDREKVMQSQLDALEEELEQAKVIIQDSDDYLDAQLSIEHKSSNSSL